MKRKGAKKHKEKEKVEAEKANEKEKEKEEEKQRGEQSGGASDTAHPMDLEDRPNTHIQKQVQKHVFHFRGFYGLALEQS